MSFCPGAWRSVSFLSSAPAVIVCPVVVPRFVRSEGAEGTRHIRRRSRDPPEGRAVIAVEWRGGNGFVLKNKTKSKAHCSHLAT